MKSDKQNINDKTLVEKSDYDPSWDKVKFTVTCEMDRAQAMAFHSMLKQMELCGKIGATRIVGMYADGDGKFHPKFESTFQCDAILPNLDLVRGIIKPAESYIYDEDLHEWKLNDFHSGDVEVFKDKGLLRR